MYGCLVHLYFWVESQGHYVLVSLPFNLEINVMTFKQIIKGFRKSRVTLDLRTDALTQLLADRKKRAQRHEALKHTAGVRSVFA
ncbi:hypothetical protein XaavBphi31_04 [Xanthomonas phage Xaa_vB_phi31]|uniref:Uncharacterized protein n=1 Tax=Xanthomonas phage Xaa_vB_phi31 TaxID=2776752 RepID=A0A868BYY2_9CAUD|nr:hypothetical protein XaavBphi31_04 [Xanthomonas phage Xaa_vB_phi31]